ncbi:cytochrome P450 [Xylaria bambusicola]|uniref:cytochrome P450 n=1 Tax=Xylaria bambusicola TaxID=326684 RepID=UPI002007904D|nr:cytochrome P450 [Xylaria bambusicola]KAI0518345.1 cytochrome P450 [Xylaria bambusicola]
MSSMSTTATWRGESQAMATKHLAFIGGILFSCILIARLVSSRSKHRTTYLTITNKNGEKLPEIDIRGKKFKSSGELSRKIKDIAGPSPCLVRTGPRQELVIAKAQHVQDLYGRDYQISTSYNVSLSGSPFGYVMPGATASPAGQDCGKTRKHFKPILSLEAVSQRISRFAREIQTWVKTLDVGFVDSRQTFDMIMFRMMYLHLYEDAYDDRRYWALLQLYLLHQKAVETTDSSAKLAKKSYKEWREFSRSIVDLAQKGRWKCPVEVIYRGVSASDMTEEAYLSTLSEIMFNNVESTGQVFSTIFTKLAANRTIQDALRLEIQVNEDARDIYLHRSDTLLHRVLQESLRLSPAIGFSTPDLTRGTRTIAGCLIPAQTPVVIDAHRVNTDPVIWGPDCDAWDPDRFLRVDANSLRCGYIPYSASAASEQWLGKDAAEVIFKITIVAIVEQISLEPVGDGEEQGSGTDLNMRRLK